MNNTIRRCLFAGLIVATTATGFAQKTKVGYHKGTDFSKYKSYTWAKPVTPITRPLLYDLAVGIVDTELTNKGLTRVESGGDLILVAAGGIEYGSNVPAGTPILSTYGTVPPNMNSTMWTGADVTWASSDPLVQQGTLVLEFVDRATNDVVWIGTVKQNVDSQQKKKSIGLVEKAIAKLLKDYPPKPSK